MNILIIYKSYSKMNTEKVAKAMAGAVNAMSELRSLPATI